MNEIISLGDKSKYVSGEWRERRAARAVVTDESGRIALIHPTKNGYYKLPGGGIDEGEDIEAALGRELLEELGVAVTITKNLGLTDEYRPSDRLHQVSYCFAARLKEQVGEPQLTQKEIAEGMEPFWANDLRHAIELVSTPEGEFYEEKGFMIQRDAAILKSTEQ